MSEKVELSVSGMSCQGCVRSVSKIISNAAGISQENVDVDLDAARASFEAPDGTDLDAITAKLEAAGFPTER